MKTLITLLILFFGFNARAGGIDGNTPVHILASAALTTAIYFTMSVFTGREKQTKLPSLIGAVGMSLAVGLGKEVVDSMIRKDRRIDGADMGANAVGVGIATGLILTFDF